MILAIDLNSFWQFCGGLAAAATVIAYVYKYVAAPVHRALRDRKMAAEKEAREHTVEIVDSRLDAKLAPIIAELTPNGGGSMKDGVAILARDFGEFKTATEDRWTALDDQLGAAQRAEQDRWSTLEGRLGTVEQNTRPGSGA